MYQNIPDEMKQYAQWVLWRYEDRNGPKPTKMPYSPLDGVTPANVNDPSTWGTFDQAIWGISQGQHTGIGFVLTERDPYAFIDLDQTETQDEYDRQLKIFQEFNSYAERSPSGNGLHIIVKGAIPSGRRRSKIEIYSNQRYMTMTGNVYRDAPISDHNDLLNLLWEQMGGSAQQLHYTGDSPETATDDEIVQRALHAANGEKFGELLNGHWAQYYPSQSEADFAFVDMVAFYTQNRAQIARIFRASPLGQRDKAKRAQYIDYMVNKSFDRLLPPVDVDGLRNQLEEYIMRQRKPEAAPMPQIAPPVESQWVGQAEISQAQPVDLTQAESTYTVPPGLIGDIARFIYAAAPRPVPEIALAGAIGLMAGICGRAYNISGTGLNQYVLLLAKTGTGKEAIANGINRLMAQVRRTVPAADEFNGPAEIASAQALIKQLGVTPSVVSVVGEFGLKLQQMSAFNAPTHLVGLRATLLDLFNKSGEGQVLRPTIYSDKDKNTKLVQAPAFSMIGESTPERFYEALNESMISEGLLPRFTIIEYYGNRPPLNRGHMNAQPGFQLVEQLGSIAAHCLMLNTANKAVHVQSDSLAETQFDEFNEYCDRQINSASGDIARQLWNRAHIKALKLAALVAVGCNPYSPVIDTTVGDWAINIIVADIKNILARFEAGEIGGPSLANEQVDEIRKAIKFYITNDWVNVAKYGHGSAQLHYLRVIPHSFIMGYCRQRAAFKRDKANPTVTVKNTIQSMLDCDEIRELNYGDKKDMKINTTGRVYMISNAAAFEI